MTAPRTAQTITRPFLGTGPAVRAVAGSVSSTAALLAERRLHQPAGHRGARLDFADGTGSRVYRETTVDGEDPREPAVLVVVFRLRAVRGRGHTLFRWESELNTPLFAGFPGFVSKLWLAHDDRGRYRGVYEWDGPERARAYVQALGWVLSLVSEPASVQAVVFPGLHRDEVLQEPELVAGHGAPAWSVLTAVDPPPGP
ncbi:MULTISPECIES: hypothetical protein [unclassified Kocuria]|uniref:hypothetical protein n=1 Tax=unclassified Kocuria TaxID=2649579 RepID=UPI00064B6381|nr:MULTISPECIES: hypothetical protein [unclassified Kocuria]KLU11450.1 hypothetical protein ABL57_01065 [Kocuria sp. SM24M-10]